MYFSPFAQVKYFSKYKMTMYAKAFICYSSNSTIYCCDRCILKRNRHAALFLMENKRGTNWIIRQRFITSVIYLIVYLGHNKTNNCGITDYILFIWWNVFFFCQVRCQQKCNEANCRKNNYKKLWLLHDQELNENPIVFKPLDLPPPTHSEERFYKIKCACRYKIDALLFSFFRLKF